MTRKAHVKRIYQQDPDTGNINQDVWVDVLRIDQLSIAQQGKDTGAQGIITNYNFKWDDDPNNFINIGDQQQENANPKRVTEQLPIKNPDDNTQSINLWIVDRLTTILQGQTSGVAGQGTRLVFNNTPFFPAPDAPAGTPSNRTTSVVKIINNDLGGSGGLDMTLGPVDWFNVYLPALTNGQKDDSQHINVEMTDDFKVLFGPDATNDSGAVGQVIKYVLGNNRPVENLFDQADPYADANTPAIRTDPLQTIVNVNWGTPAKSVVWLFGPRGSTTVIGQMMKSGDKDYISISNQNPAEPSPTGPVIDVPTDTFSANKTTVTQNPIFPQFTDTVIIIGNNVTLTPATVKIDWRGYTQVTYYKFDSLGAWSPSNPAGSLFFDFNGKQIAKIPSDAAQKRGRLIAKDDEGAVYILGEQITSTSVGGVLTKYDQQGNVLWKRTGPDDSPNAGYDAAYYDTKNNRIIATQVGSSWFEKDFLDLGGGVLSNIQNSFTISNAVCSRNGKVFATYPPDPNSTISSNNGLVGFDIFGNETFRTGNPPDGDPYILAFEPFGERYLVADFTKAYSTQVNIGGTYYQTSYRQDFTRVYDADIGKLLNETQWNGQNVFHNDVTDLSGYFPPAQFYHSTVQQFNQNTDNYSFIDGIAAQYTFPRTDWPLP